MNCRVEDPDTGSLELRGFSGMDDWTSNFFCFKVPTQDEIRDCLDEIFGVQGIGSIFVALLFDDDQSWMDEYAHFAVVTWL